MRKELRKAIIMQRIRLRNLCVRIVFKKYLILKVSMWNLLRSIKNFGKKSRPFFQTKLNQKKKITLVENIEIISSDIEVEETHLPKTTHNPVLACIEKFSKHPSIVSIKKCMETTSNKFSPK